MQALGFSEHGDLSKMQLLELAKPQPGPGEVLLQVKASAFNHLDIWVREGWPGLKLQLPHISGSDAAGIVAALGLGVESAKIGERVAVDPGISLYRDTFTLRGEHSVSPGYVILGEQIPGTHAEYITVPAENLVPLPEHITFEQAAANGLVCLTAYRMLLRRAQLKMGETVLILGAGGGVNSVAIQLAKLCGCSVYTITSSANKMAQAKALGADYVANYKEDPEWAKKFFQHTKKQGFDVVVDNVGKATMAQSLRLVKRGGRIVIVGNTSGADFGLDIRYLFSKQISLIGSTMGNHADYLATMDLLFQQRLQAPIHTVVPLSDGIAAMQTMEQGDQFGKIVLSYA